MSMERLYHVQWDSSGKEKYDTKPWALIWFFRSDPGQGWRTDIWCLVWSSDALNLLYFKSVPVIATFDPTWPFPAGSLYTQTGRAPCGDQTAISPPKHLKPWLRPQKAWDKTKKSVLGAFFLLSVFWNFSVRMNYVFKSVSWQEG